MIKFKNILLPILSVFLLTFNCEASSYDSTELEKMQAQSDRLIQQMDDSIKAASVQDDGVSSAASETHSGPSGQEIYLQDSIKKHEFKKEDWKDATKGLSYNEKTEKPKPQKESHNTYHPSDSGSFFQLDSSLGQMILIIVVACLLGFILFKIFSGNVSNTKVGKQKTYRIEEIEDALHESDLERYLREAIMNKEYRIAIRIYYLMAIKALSEREWIKWKKDKTNNQYLFEMSTRPNFSGFRDITRLFEFAWYGEMTVDEKHFQLLDPKFRDFLKQINTLPA